MTAQLEKTDSSQIAITNTPEDNMECGDISTESPATYAGAAGGGNHVITFVLEADKKNDFLVTVPEVAKLVYSRLNAPPKTLISFDDTSYGKLTIVLQGTVDLGQLILTQALTIRDGLRTKPFKREHKEKIVNIFWAPASLSNSKIQETLAKFGEINPHVGVENKIYHAKDDDDDLTKMMDGVILPDREVSMTILAPIPSHIMVEGIKIKVMYEGQARTCARCYRYWGQCPGSGNAAKCREKQEAENKERVDKGEKAKKAPSFKSNWNKLEKSLEQKMKEERKKHGIEVKNKPTPSMIKITGFPKEATLAEICNLFKKNNCDIENLDDKVEITGAQGDGPVLLTDLDQIDYELVMEQMDGLFIKGKRLKAVAIQDVTPEKDARPDPNPEDQDMSSPSSQDAEAAKTPTDTAASGNEVQKSLFQSVRDKFQPSKEVLSKQTPGGSKLYQRVTKSGTKVETRKTPHSSTGDEGSGSPPLSQRGNDNVSKRRRNQKNK